MAAGRTWARWVVDRGRPGRWLLGIQKGGCGTAQGRIGKDERVMFADSRFRLRLRGVGQVIEAIGRCQESSRARQS